MRNVFRRTNASYQMDAGLQEYFKTPGRQVYSWTLWDWFKSCLWCHVGIKFVRPARGFTTLPE